MPATTLYNLCFIIETISLCLPLYGFFDNWCSRSYSPEGGVDDTRATASKRLIGHSYKCIGSNWLSNRGKQKGFIQLMIAMCGVHPRDFGPGFNTYSAGSLV